MSSFELPASNIPIILVPGSPGLACHRELQALMLKPEKKTNTDYWIIPSALSALPIGWATFWTPSSPLWSLIITILITLTSPAEMIQQCLNYSADE